jgi:hypothetical protein
MMVHVKSADMFHQLIFNLLHFGTKIIILSLPLEKRLLKLLAYRNSPCDGRIDLKVAHINPTF